MVALGLSGVVAGMLALSFAAVPLYRLFCQVTGYAGTTQRADAAPEAALDRTMVVRFDANKARALPWRFEPAQRAVEVRVGESALIFYRAVNLASTPVTGTATFNVTPEAAGAYFNKIDCFCFVEQRLEPGQVVDMPVTFFIDPAIEQDASAKGVRQITLSYTFFPAQEGPLAAAGGGKGS